jgi:hypothetical protein
MVISKIGWIFLLLINGFVTLSFALDFNNWSRKFAAGKKGHAHQMQIEDKYYYDPKWAFSMVNKKRRFRPKLNCKPFFNFNALSVNTVYVQKLSIIMHIIMYASGCIILEKPY